MQLDLLKDINSGYTCSCCGSFCKLYRKPLVGEAVRDLIILTQLYKQRGEAIHISEFTKQRSNFYTLKYWWLIEPGEVVVDKKKRASGYWKPTSKGELFVKDELEIQSVAETYNNKLVKLSGKYINVITALKEQFDYSKLMNGD